ncbi:MAG: hypothetical protein WB609_09360 [Candidatus Cybelea sp.]
MRCEFQPPRIYLARRSDERINNNGEFTGIADDESAGGIPAYVAIPGQLPHFVASESYGHESDEEHNS